MSGMLVETKIRQGPDGRWLVILFVDGRPILMSEPKATREEVVAISNRFVDDLKARHPEGREITVPDRLATNDKVH